MIEISYICIVLTIVGIVYVTIDGTNDRYHWIDKIKSKFHK